MILINEGEFVDFFYVVVEGKVEFFVNVNGCEVMMVVVGLFGIFIFVVVFKDVVYLMLVCINE